jgi:DNA gyrase subunit B
MEEKPTERKEEYDASHITVLASMEAIRKRPGMYVGSTGLRGLHHLVHEVVDNSIDESMAGYCSKIQVIIHKDNKIEVRDNGRGIPVDIHPKYGLSALEIVMTKLHAGGKFDKKTYKVSGGLHGVGISVVNALSSELEVYVSRGGKLYYQKYAMGEPVERVKVIGDSEGTGTITVFLADSSIFETIEYDFDVLSSRMRELAFLNRGVEISIIDERTGNNHVFRYDGGIVEFVKYLNESKRTFHEPICFTKEKGGIQLEIAMQYNDGYREDLFAFVNNINTTEGGTHVSGLKTALTRTLNSYGEKNAGKEFEQLTSDDVREGLTCVISVKIPEPQFEGQTKTKLGNSEVKGLVDSMVSSGLSTFLEENPSIARLILEKSLTAAKARIAAKKARDLTRRKSALNSHSLPGKLADCSEKDPEKCEVFLVEGDSAGGCFSGDTKVTLVDGRNLSFRELVEEDKEEKKNYCYTIKDDGSIGTGLIVSPRLTKRDSEVIRVTLDNGEEITCTPDHKFMTRDRGYIQAQNLKKDTSLMPLSRKMSKIEGRITIKGYEMVYDTKKRRWVFTHMLSDRYNLDNGRYDFSSGDHKHHIDFNKLNNNPENIARIRKEDHLRLHANIVEKTLHTENARRRAKEAHANPEYKRKVSAIMSTPEMREMLSLRAQAQWKNKQYKDFMLKKFIEFYNTNEDYRRICLEKLKESQRVYWSREENRKLQSERVKRYFEAHPEALLKLKKLAKEQWQDEELLRMRSETTKKQWTEEFREKRKVAYNKTYFEHTIRFMKQILENYGNLEAYDNERAKSRNKNLLKKDTFAQRFFGNDEDAMMEAVENYNHKIKRIERLNSLVDVYDLEVEGTHNFALASGVFVHNSAKQGRNRAFQAILPLRGKILNVEKARLHKILTNEEIITMITAIGTNVGEEFDITKARYHKIIIMTDADVDGAHIRTLLLTFFFRYMKPLIENGYVYIANPPLYKVSKGNKHVYVYSEEALEKALQEFGREDAGLQRYKGLGEMNPTQLWETTMDPDKRTLVRVAIEDAIEADRIFSVLMGDEVEPRRLFIEENAKYVKNLDV